MRVLGIDPSLTGTGCVTVKDDGVEEELIRTKKLGDRPVDELKRLNSITSRVLALSGNVELAIIEGLAFTARNTTALTQLSALNYFIRNGLHQMGVPFLVVAPTSLKKFVTGKGNVNKNLMFLETYKRYGLSFTDDNLCDAHGLARIGEALVTGGKLPKHQQEVTNLLSKQV